MGTLSQDKNASGYFMSSVVQGDSEVTITTRDRTTEVWSLLEYYYKIKDTRKAFIMNQGITDPMILGNVERAFESYVVQSRNFYQYAQDSDYRSAALLYYYSYLNLAKASIILRHPELAGKSLVHGLSESKDVEKFDVMASRVSDRSNGVLGLLYEDRFGVALPATTSFKLVDMLGYTEEISREYVQALGVENKISNMRYAIAIDNKRKKCWPVVAIQRWAIFSEYAKCTKALNAEFIKIDPSTLMTEFAFSIKGFQRLYFEFFESKVEHDLIGGTGINFPACDHQMMRAVENVFQSELYDDEIACKLVLPHDAKTELRMDEVIAGYVAMHRLSEVVRYHPDLFMTILSDDTKEGWLVKNFIQVSSYNFLQRMVSSITGKQILFLTR